MTEAIKPQKMTAKDKLIAAAFSLIRKNGYASTTVDELCHEAGVTKGSFFHYFASKEALAVAAAHAWSERNRELFGSASYHKHKDPLKRLLGYIDFRKDLIRGEISQFTCLVGTMVQENYESAPNIRRACEESIVGHAQSLEADIAESIRLYKPKEKITAEGLALHTQAVIQGSFILAKAKTDPEMVLDSLDHLKKYFRLLFSTN
jgi:TetR/AcrR family transcriptional repressor of nem operon